MIVVKILSYHPAQRFALRQTVIAVEQVLQKEHPGLKIAITELKDWQNIEKYTPVISAPSLVVNDNLVCVGRLPSKQEVLGWIKKTMGELQA